MLAVEGIVIRTLKYGETSLILDLYTKEKGLISCIAGGVRKKRSTLHASTLQLLQIVQATIYYKDSEQLNRLKEAQPSVYLNDLVDDPVKRVVVIFLSEVLQKSIREKESRPELYSFLLNSLTLLNEMKEGVANFHLIFMIELSRYLGFYPIANYNKTKPYFDLDGGKFVELPDARNTLDEIESAQMAALFNMEFGQQNSEVLSNSQERQLALNSLIRYFQYHVEGFGKLKTPEILHVILS
jgi:DNA repair protein RecO (recombination protein O)